MSEIDVAKVPNPVGFLQEVVQKFNPGPFPQYSDEGTAGALTHCPTFTVKCSFAGHEVCASAGQKKAAKTEAARLMVEKLKQNGFFEQFGYDLTDGIKKAAQPLAVGGKSPISLLQEYGQQQKLHLPNYVDTNPIAGVFACECRLGEFKSVGRGPNKKTAKERAATQMCVNLQLLPPSSVRSTNVDSASVVAVGAPSDRQNGTGANKTAGGKNPIMALNEFCQRNKLPQPVFTDCGCFLNLYSFECAVGSVKCLGRDSSKQGAKAQAAFDCLKALMKNMPAYIAGLEDPETGLENGLAELTLKSPKREPIPEYVETNVREDVEQPAELTLKSPKREPIPEYVETNVREEVERPFDRPALDPFIPEDSVVEIEPRSDEIEPALSNGAPASGKSGESPVSENAPVKTTATSNGDSS